MRKFSKQLKFLALGLILVGSLGLSMSTKVTLVARQPPLRLTFQLPYYLRQWPAESQ